MFPATCKHKVLVSAIKFEAVVDVVGSGEIGKDLSPATFVVNDRRVLVAVAVAYGLAQPAMWTYRKSQAFGNWLGIVSGSG